MTDVPTDFLEALKESGLDAFFADCTGPRRREYLKWIAEAKRPETRRQRIVKAMQMLSARRADETARSKKNA
jgi:uncharacterized protein YdeI (YjbR/CyaY-like superfamily)